MSKKDQIKSTNSKKQHIVSYTTYVQKSFLVLLFKSLGYTITFFPPLKKTSMIKDYRIEYVYKTNENGTKDILIDSHSIFQRMKEEMTKENANVTTSQIWKNCNLKTIKLMIDYLLTIEFSIDNSPLKKCGGYGLGANFRIHSVEIPQQYILSIYESISHHFDLTNTQIINLSNSLLSGSLSDNEVNKLGELYVENELNKLFQINLQVSDK